MSNNSMGEDASIDLSVNADEALQVFEQLSAAARDADEQVQQLKQHLTQQVTATFGAQGLRPQNDEQASGFLSRMDPAEVAQAAPEIAQTKNALAARSADIQAQALDFVGTNPQIVAQPLPDTLAQFQQSMVQRDQQQQAQQERQAQQQAAGIERPARYGYAPAPPSAQPQGDALSAGVSMNAPIPPTTTMPRVQIPLALSGAPLTTAGDDRLAQALTAAPTTPGTTGSDAPVPEGVPDSPTLAPTPLPATPVDIQTPAPRFVAPLATTGDDRLMQALTAQSPVGTTTGAADVSPVTDGTAPIGAPSGALPDDLRQLADAARAADEGVQTLGQRLLDLWNAIPSNRQASSPEDVQKRLSTMDTSLIQDTQPALAQTSVAYQARQFEVTGQVRDFAADNPEAAAEPLPTQQDMLTRWQELLRQHNQQQQATSGQGQNDGDGQGGDSSLPNAGGATYYRQSVPSGPLVPSGMERLARYGYDAAQRMDARDARQQQPPFGQGGARGGGNSTDTTQQDRSATVLGDHIAQALTRSAGGLVAGGISGAANAAGMGATGDVLAGLVRPLMGLVGEAAPLALGAIGAIGGVAGIGLGVNALQSRYAGEQQTLAGSVGTTTGATPSSELTTAQNAGWSMMYHEAQSVAAAQQLGDAGVSSSQLGAGLTASMALSRVGGIGLDQTTALTGQMMQSGMSGNQVGDMYAQTTEAARQSGVSLGRLVDGIKELNQASGVGQISVNGLAAAQALAAQTGTNIDIARAMSGTVGATGTGALAQGALLGLNPAQFEAAQRDPAKLWDAYANTARRYDVGSGGERVAQQALSTAGFDFSGMKGPQADEFIRRLVSEGPGAAQKYEQSLQQKEAAPGAPGPHNFDELTKAGTHVANDITSAGDKFKIAAEQAASTLVRAVDGVKITTPLTVPAAAAQSSADQAQQALIDAARRRGPAAQLHIVQTAQNPAAKAQALLGYEAITSGQDYANDPNAAGTMDASGSAQFGGLSEYDLSQARQSGTWTGGAAGKGSFVDAPTFHAYEQAARKTGTPLPILLAQGAKEATINGQVSPSARSSDGGVGLGQWTPGPHNENLPTVEHYLGMASKDLGMGAVTAQNWQQAALNPRVSALATGIYDADLYKQSGDKWTEAMARYNGGNNPGAQAQAYGTSVNQAALKVEVQLGGSVDITQNGQKVASAQAGQHIRATATHSVDPSRKQVAAQSYGPDSRTPPAPGLPTLPGHIAALPRHG